jgi:hypothetical protein
MAKAWLMVRAVVAEPADRPRFDRWYAEEHLPDALKAFGAARAWRCWSALDPRTHFAFYEFPDLARAQQISDSPEIRTLIAEFDRVWGDRVTRTREVMELAGELAAAAAR